MSNFLAIATVTATLSETIRPAVARDVTGAEVTMTRPDDAGEASSNTRVNLYLYQVTPNAAWRNADLPTRNSNGQLVQRPQAALDLHYLLSFYGKEAKLEPQRLLGSVVRTLNAKPVLTRQMIQKTLATSGLDFLSDSNLHDSIELVKFTPLPLSLEELSKLWSVFFQTPYTLSVAYQGTVVLIESEDTPQAALPVRERKVYVIPFQQPVIEQIKSQEKAGDPIVADQPILAGYNLVVVCRNLRGEHVLVNVGGIKVTPPPEDVSETQIIVALPTALFAGVHGVQVIHQTLMGSPPVPHRGVESNLAAFVLSPTIKKDPATGEYQIEISESQTDSDDTPTVNVLVKLKPHVAKEQRVVLLLNEFNPPSDRPPRAYSFEAKSADQPAPPPESAEEITFSVSGMRAGTYLVRVQVDGAESPLETDSAGRYNSPKVTIP